MAMRFLERLSHLVRADAHGVLSRLEERELLVAQALRDAELALRDKEQRLAARALVEKQLRVRGARVASALEQRDRDIALALSRDESDLARFATREFLAFRREHERIEHELAAVVEERSTLEEEIAADRASLEEMRARADACAVRDARATEARPDTVAEADIELELMRRRGASEAAHGRA